MSDTARVLLTAAVLSSTALAVYLWMLTRLDPAGPERLVAQLRLAQWAALVLAATGAVSIGIAVAAEGVPFGTIEVTLGVAFIVVAALVMQREPLDALRLAVAAFVLHAIITLAHRPGGFTPLAPAWYTVGSAIYDVFFAAVCSWARRR